MAIRTRQRFFLKEWLKHRGYTYERFANELGTSKGVISDLANGKERYHRDHLWEFAEILDCEPWQLLEENPLEPPPPEIDSIVQEIRRIPVEQLPRIAAVIRAFTAGEPHSPGANNDIKRKKRSA